MNDKRLVGAIAGALVAGLGITVMVLVGERKTGKPSELAGLERTGARKLGFEVPPDDRRPEPQEQAVIQAGHLALSAAAGAAYAVAVEDDAGVLSSGVAFGLTFYAAMHWIAGPLLGLKPAEWRSTAGTIGSRALIHLAFGLATAGGARAASRI